jgi:hypothetical protein
VYKELMGMKKDHVDLDNAIGLDSRFEAAERDRRGSAYGVGSGGVSRPDSHLRAGVVAVSERWEPIRASEDHEDGLARGFAKSKDAILQDLRSAIILLDLFKLSAGAWPTSGSRSCFGMAMRRFSKSTRQMKLMMKRVALQKLNRKANEGWPGFATVGCFWALLSMPGSSLMRGSGLESKEQQMSGRSAAW